MTLEDVKYRFNPVYLLPILASLFFGLGCAWVLTLQQKEVVIPDNVHAVPLPDNTATGPLGNAMFFMILIAISATMFYFLLKQKNLKAIKVIIFLAMSAASMMLSMIYLSIFLVNLNFYNFPLIIGLSLFITVLFNLAIFKYTKVQSIAVICLGGAFGALFSFLLPLYSTIAILIVIAIYDIFAVYRGPVGKIAQSGMEQLNGLSYSFKDMQMGLGDLFFYAILTCNMFYNFPDSPLPTIMAIIGICAGAVITFFMLEKKGIFPGLPFPIALGLALGFITAMLI